MRKKAIFQGCCTALITPFYESGEINYFKLKELIEYQIASGTNAILVLGTTGEAATISKEERIKIIKFCKFEIAGRVPLIVGCGSNSTIGTIKLLTSAEKLGADAGLVVTPYYNKCSQQGLILHYKELTKHTTLPIIVYNVPSRTGVNILPETMQKLAKIKGIVGLKEASSNMMQMAKLLNILPKDFAVYSGDDALCLPAMFLGAKGVISVTSNAYPEKVSLMCEYARIGQYKNALNLHNLLLKLSNALFLDINPICIKTYMNIVGFEVGGLRLPLSNPNKKVYKTLEKVASHYEN